MDGWKITVLVVVGILVLCGITIVPMSCTIVPAGTVGVVDIFGTVREGELKQGLHFINPLAKCVEFSVKTVEMKQTMDVPTKEGMMAGLDVSVLYKVDPEKASNLYNTVGVLYDDVVIVPNLRNVTRDVVATFVSDDLYGAKRQQIATDIARDLGPICKERGVLLESVLLRDVRLPEEVTAAIERKIKAKQEAEQMQYVLDKEKQEAERKRIEAKGIADAQKIIAESLDAPYLQWKYISTLSELVGSENTTFVITPFDQKLIPLLPLK